LRGAADDQVLSLAMGALPHVTLYEPDLSQAAMLRSIEEEAADQALPLERRLQSLLFSAHIDYAHKRFPDALEKFGILLKYHVGMRNETMTALVLNAVGETHARMGNVEHAGQCFESAFVPASKAPGPPIPLMLNIVLNLANLRMGQKRWEEGEAYYDSVHQLASVQRDASTKVSAIENLGQCQYMQGKVKDALATWHAGATLAGKLELENNRRSMLERLAKHYKSAGESAQYSEVKKQLSRPPEPAALPPS
jgi:tetratricopeptide (TPR) repeat protein